jgi:hypothetical protein
MTGKVTYSSLRRWAHMPGFGGHFLTKARRYSVTLTALRQARITYRRHQDAGLAGCRHGCALSSSARRQRRADAHRITNVI